MPRSPDLIGAYSSRAESPEVELLLQELIGDALALLLSKKSLYQKTEPQLDRVNKHLELIKSPNFELIKVEFSKRPWVPISPNVATEDRMRAEFFCGVGDSPLSAQDVERKLAFPLPSIKLYCSSCKEEHTFSSVTVMWWDGFTNYFPKF